MDLKLDVLQNEDENMQQGMKVKKCHWGGGGGKCIYICISVLSVFEIASLFVFVSAFEFVFVFFFNLKESEKRSE